jgi:hypothetical protein
MINAAATLDSEMNEDWPVTAQEQNDHLLALRLQEDFEAEIQKQEAEDLRFAENLSSEESATRQEKRRRTTPKPGSDEFAEAVQQSSQHPTPKGDISAGGSPLRS